MKLVPKRHRSFTNPLTKMKLKCSEQNRIPGLIISYIKYTQVISV